MSQRCGLIFGISGQDGAYLSKFLLSKNYKIYGVSRNVTAASLENLVKLGVDDKVRLCSVDTNNLADTTSLIEKVMPDEIYDLAGQTSVGLSFERPVETFKSISVRAVNILEALRLLRSPTRLFHASSAECFGETAVPADEMTPFRPRSPYAMSKASAFWANATYRESYGLYVSCGILSNHESPLRPERFVTRKIIKAAARIGQGKQERLSLGFLGIRRDWGWAAEFVEAMWRTLQCDVPSDYIIATGQTRSLEEFVSLAFKQYGKDWQDYVDLDEQSFRPTEIMNAEFTPSLAARCLNWTARSDMSNVVKYLSYCEANGGIGPLPWVDKTYELHV